MGGEQEPVGAQHLPVHQRPPERHRTGTRRHRAGHQGLQAEPQHHRHPAGGNRLHAAVQRLFGPGLRGVQPAGDRQDDQAVHQRSRPRERPDAGELRPLEREHRGADPRVQHRPPRAGPLPEPLQREQPVRAGPEQEPGDVQARREPVHRQPHLHPAAAGEQDRGAGERCSCR